MYYVYLIQHDFSGELYIGSTDDPSRRLSEHNSSSNQSYTARSNGSWQYVYLELYRSKKDALLRERRLKNHAKGKHELLKRLQNSLSPKLVREKVKT